MVGACEQERGGVHHLVKGPKAKAYKLLVHFLFGQSIAQRNAGGVGGGGLEGGGERGERPEGEGSAAIKLHADGGRGGRGARNGRRRGLEGGAGGEGER